jgi:MFS family permease
MALSDRDRTVAMARRLGRAHVLFRGQLVGVVGGVMLGVTAAVLLDPWWWAVVVCAYLGAISGASAGSGTAGIAVFRRYDRREVGQAAGAAAFGVGAAAGAGAGGWIGRLIETAHRPDGPAHLTAWVGVFTGFAVVGALAGGVVGGAYGQGLAPVLQALVPTLLAGFACAGGAAIGQHVPVVFGVLITVVFLAVSTVWSAFILASNDDDRELGPPVLW